MDLSCLCPELLMEIGIRLEERGLRNLMRVSKAYNAFAQTVIVHGHIRLSVWSMRIFVNYLKSHVMADIQEAYNMNKFICQRAGPPSFVPLEDALTALLETETRNFYKVMTHCRLPTPEIILCNIFSRMGIYSGQTIWSTEDQVFWFPPAIITPEYFELEMSKCPGDTFMGSVLALHSQPIYSDFMIPFLMSHYILPCYLNGNGQKWSPEIKLFLGRLSRATHCFDRYLAILFLLSEKSDHSLILKSRLTVLCKRLDCKFAGIPWDLTYDRIKTSKHLDTWRKNSKALILFGSMCGFDAADLAGRLQPVRPGRTTITPDQVLLNFAIGHWADPQIPTTFSGFIMATMKSKPLPVQAIRGKIVTLDEVDFIQ
jgi:hypothetical protein